MVERARLEIVYSRKVIVGSNPTPSAHVANEQNEEQNKKLGLAQLAALKRGLEKRITKNYKVVEEIKKSSAENIKKISGELNSGIKISSS